MKSAKTLSVTLVILKRGIYRSRLTLQDQLPVTQETPQLVRD